MNDLSPLGYVCVCFRGVTVYVQMRPRNTTVRTLLLAHLAVGCIGFLPHASFPGLHTKELSVQPN